MAVLEGNTEAPQVTSGFNDSTIAEMEDALQEEGFDLSSGAEGDEAGEPETEEPPEVEAEPAEQPDDDIGSEDPGEAAPESPTPPEPSPTPEAAHLESLQRQNEFLQKLVTTGQQPQQQAAPPVDQFRTQMNHLGTDQGFKEFLNQAGLDPADARDRVFGKMYLKQMELEHSSQVKDQQYQARLQHYENQAREAQVQQTLAPALEQANASILNDQQRENLQGAARYYIDHGSDAASAMQQALQYTGYDELIALKQQAETKKTTPRRTVNPRTLAAASVTAQASARPPRKKRGPVTTAQMEDLEKVVALEGFMGFPGKG